MAIKNKIFVTAIVAVVICVTGILGGIILSEVGDVPEAKVYANEIVVEGRFSEEIPLENATVTYVDGPVVVTMRLKGMSDEVSLKGTYNVADIDKACYVSILNKANSYIQIESEGEFYLLNCATNEETTSLYNEILVKIEAK